MAHAPGHSDLPPELEGLLAGLGIDGSAFAAPTETGPVVYMGTESQRRHAPGGRFGGMGRTRSVEVDDVMTVDEATAMFYAMTDEELRDFQERAFAAGLYGTTDRSKVRFGDPTDGVTYNLWADRVDAAAGFYNNGAGRKLTPWDTLDLAAKGQTGLGTPADEGRDPGANIVSNPDDLRATFQAITQEALGQALPADQLNKMIASFRARQVATNRSADAAAETGAVVEQAPDPRTFADQEAKRADPTAYSAYRVLDKFSQVLETFGSQA